MLIIRPEFKYFHLNFPKRHPGVRTSTSEESGRFGRVHGKGGEGTELMRFCP